MAYENIVAVFRALADANAAVNELQTDGIGANDIKLHSSANPMAPSPAGKGIWAQLLGDSAPESTSDEYEACIANGWIVVSVTALVEKSDRVIATLGNHSPVDLEKSVETYGSTEDAPAKKMERRLIRRFSSIVNPATEL